MYCDLAEIRIDRLQVLRKMLFSHVGRRMLVAALHTSWRSVPARHPA